MASPPFTLLGYYDTSCSALEAILGAGCGVLSRHVLASLTQAEALPLRAASRACREAVAEHAWGELVQVGRNEAPSRIKGSLASWRRCFPHAVAANVIGRTFPEADLVHLRGMRTLHMTYYTQATDGCLAHLHSIHTLYMDACTQMTDADLAHLQGIHTLHMSGRCALITDAGLAHLRGIHTLYMSDCKITDAGLACLRGIHTLRMFNCALITDAGLEHLRGIHTLWMCGSTLVTDAGYAHLSGIHSLNVAMLNITDAGLLALRT